MPKATSSAQSQTPDKPTKGRGSGKPAPGVAIYKDRYAPKSPRDWFKPGAPITDDALIAACGLIASGATVAEAAIEIGISPNGLWIALNTRAVEMYTRAREILADQHAGAILGVMRDVAGGKLTESQGRIVMDGAKWLAERLDGKRFGQYQRPTDPEAEAARQAQAMGNEAARLALAGIVAAIGYNLQPAQKEAAAILDAIPGESKQIK